MSHICILIQRTVPFFCAFFWILNLEQVSLAEQYSKDPPLEDLVRYYPEVTKGLINPRIQPEIEPSVFPGTPLQDYFFLDSDRFTQEENRKDFLSAKIRFYKRQRFNELTQKYERPYYYLSSWTSLFHPPIKAAKGALAKFYENYHPDLLEDNLRNSPYFDVGFQRHLDVLSGTEITAQNQLTLLTNATGYQNKIQLAGQAKTFFFGMVMVYFCDSSTENLLDQMAIQVKAGVDVRMIVEGLYGSTVARGCVKKMRKAGINVLFVKDSMKLKSLGWVFHNKIWIQDGKQAIIGGQNIHQYETKSTGFNGLMRDTDVLVSGPAATDLTREYLQLWRRYSKKIDSKFPEYEVMNQKQMETERAAHIRGPEFYDQWLNDPNTRMNGVCRALVQNVTHKYEMIAPVYAEYIKNAQNQIQISTPSVSYPTSKSKRNRWPRVLADLLKERALNAGVKVDLLSNGSDGGSGTLSAFLRKISSLKESQESFFAKLIIDRLDHAISALSARSTRKKILDLTSVSQNIRGWTYFQYIHAKQSFFDRIATSIGSVNFDSHSLEKNHEATLICLDQRLAQQMENQFTLDLINSIPVLEDPGMDYAAIYSKH